MANALATHGISQVLREKVLHWEEAGTRLESAITTYLDSCVEVERFTTTASLVDSDNLATRLHHRMKHFHSLFVQPLAQSLASFARTRNKIVTPIYRIPREILGNIFECTMNNVPKDLPMDRAVVDTYLQLHRITAVSSFWRKIGLTHAPLWTLIPLINSRSDPGALTVNPACLSLERAGGSELRLAADTGNLFLSNLPIANQLIITAHAHRFRSINLRYSGLPALESILEPILETALPGSLSELSLCYNPEVPSNPEGGRWSIVSSPHLQLQSKQTAFERTLNSLRVFRLKGVTLPRSNLLLSNLVELRIQDIMFNCEEALEQFMRALASAASLQTLDLISVWIMSPPALPILAPDDLCLFQSLQTLFIEDLENEIIHTVLSVITPGTHRTVLSVTDRNWPRYLQGYNLPQDIQELQAALQIQPHNIDTLVFGKMWLPDHGDVLCSLFAFLPALTTIYLDKQSLDHKMLVNLTRRPYIPHSEIDLPHLHRIYISRSTIYIDDQTAFKNMLSSHPLEELVLGGGFIEIVHSNDPESGGGVRTSYETHDITGLHVRTTPIKNWLRENVPKLTLLGSEEPVRFKSKEWLLW